MSIKESSELKYEKFLISGINITSIIYIILFIKQKFKYIYIIDKIFFWSLALLVELSW